MASAISISPSCDFCHTDSGSFSHLSCYHTLCKKCLEQNTHENIIRCPRVDCRCITYTNAVTQNERNVWEVETLNKEEELSDAIAEYRKDLDAQEDNIANEIGKIKAELKKSKQTVQATKKEINAIYKNRLVQLELHFKKLENQVEQHNTEHKKQMKKVMSILEDIKDVIKQQKETFAAFIKNHLPQINTDDALHFLETEINKSEVVETYFPAFEMAIEISQDWQIKDDIKLSPPEAPKILRKRKAQKKLSKKRLPAKKTGAAGIVDLNASSEQNKSSSGPDNFSVFLGKKLRNTNQMKLPAVPRSVCIIDNELYLADTDGNVYKVNAVLTKKRKLKTAYAGDVFGVAALMNTSLIIAGEKGLFQVSTQGARLQQVNKGEHTQVQCRSNRVCTLQSSGKYSTPDTLMLYTYSDNQFTKTISFQLSFVSQLDITISLGSDVVYVANYDNHCIHVLSHDGTKLAKQGRSGRNDVAGELCGPRVATTDSQDNLLVCDTDNDRLQMMTRDGKWQLLQCDKELKWPSDAVVVGDQVFVVGDRGNDPYVCILQTSK